MVNLSSFVRHSFDMKYDKRGDCDDDAEEEKVDDDDEDNAEDINNDDDPLTWSRSICSKIFATLPVGFPSSDSPC